MCVLLGIVVACVVVVVTGSLVCAALAVEIGVVFSRELRRL